MKQLFITASKLPHNIVGSECTLKSGLYVHEIVYESNAQLDKVQEYCWHHRLSFAVLKEWTIPKAVFFDMDGTVIKQETIVELARSVGTADVVHNITEQAMRGDIDFSTALKSRVATLKGMHVKQFDAVYEKFLVARGLTNLLSTLRDYRIPYFLVSGGFTYFAQRFGKQYDFQGYFANDLESNNGVLTGGIDGKIVDAHAKKEYLLKKCRELNISPNQAMAVGDGANDIEMLQLTGLSSGFNPRPILKQHVNIAGFEDHTFISDLIKLAASQLV